MVVVVVVLCCVVLCCVVVLLCCCVVGCCGCSCCCCCSDDSLRCVYVNNTRVTNWQDPVPSHLGVKLPATPAPRGALDDEELFIVEGSKNWRSTPGTTGGARKVTQNASKRPIAAPILSLNSVDD